MPYGLERWLAGRWIAGPGIEDAIGLAEGANKRRVSVMINYLGEDFTRRADVQEAVDTYLSLMTRMAEGRINGAVSVKPSQIGLRISHVLMKQNYLKVMERARTNGLFVWLDMEEPRYVPAVIRMYLEVGRQGGGVCIQAYLKRSLDDAKRITRQGGTIRLVKGAYGYREGAGMIQGRDGIRSSYLGIMGYLFGHAKRFMVATHDGELIREGEKLGKRHRGKVTYAMLNGIDNPKAVRLAARGENVALYVPFGTRWVGYSHRRLKEIGHIRLIIRSLFRSQQL